MRVLPVQVSPCLADLTRRAAVIWLLLFHIFRPDRLRWWVALFPCVVWVVADGLGQDVLHSEWVGRAPAEVTIGLETRMMPLESKCRMDVLDVVYTRKHCNLRRVLVNRRIDRVELGGLVRMDVG